MSAPDLETALKDLCAAVARGEGSVVLASAGGDDTMWESSALSSIRMAIPPFATVALGGAVRATKVDGGVILVVPLSRPKVAELRRLCDDVMSAGPTTGPDSRVLRSEIEEEIVRYGGALALLALADAGIAWLGAVDAKCLDPYSITDARRYMASAITTIRTALAKGAETVMSESNYESNLEQEHRELQDRMVALQAENDRLMADLKDGPLPGGALVSAGSTDSDMDGAMNEHDHPIVSKVAHAMNVIANDGESMEDAVLRSANHDRDLRTELSEQLAANRGIVMRVASILGVQKWDADGTEIIEKAQRWSVFANAIKNRLKATAMMGGTEVSARVEELTAVYIQLTGTEPVAKWVAGKPAAAVPGSLMDSTPGIPSWRSGPFNKEELYEILRALQEGSGDPDAIDLTFSGILSSAVATSEFVQFMNLVILPHLSRMP